MTCKYMWIDIIGYVGGSILGIQLIPQIVKVYKTKSGEDISLFFLFLNILGLGLMTTYGILIHKLPLCIPTGISLVNSIILLLLILKYRTQLKNNEEENVCFLL